jgi:hypothetical protein
MAVTKRAFLLRNAPAANTPVACSSDPMPRSQQASLRGRCSSNCIAEIALAAIFWERTAPCMSGKQHIEE